MKTKIYLSILKQQIITNIYLAEVYLLILLALGEYYYIIGAKNKSIKLLCQVHRTTRFKFIRILIEPAIKKNISVLYSRSGRLDPHEIESYLGTRIMVLKSPSGNCEKGVLYIMFSELFKIIPRAFNMEKLLNDYTLVFEPSWSGYCDEDILYYTKYNEEIYLLAAEVGDFQFLTRLNSNLKPLPFGPCDWIDPVFFDRYQEKENKKEYDIIMNSHWGWSKRHHMLFKSIKDLTENVKIAMIGRPWKGRQLEDVKNLARFYGVKAQIDYYEDVSYKDVIRITSLCKMGLLLSLKEGSNRAMSESLFCNVPVIVLSEHVGGIRKNINSDTGMLVPQNKLKYAIKKMLSSYSSYNPKKWALKNISCVVSSEKLNDYLKSRSCTLGRIWTRDIAMRTNSPESKYFNKSDEEEFNKYNLGLKEYLHQ